MEVTRLFDILDNYLESYPTQEAALACKRNGEWRKFSIQEYCEQTNYISYGMLKLGIKPADKIGIVSSNRPEWNMIDFAIMQIGAISIPIYPTISQADYRHILNHAEMKMIFVEGKELGNKLKPIFEETSGVPSVSFTNQSGCSLKMREFFSAINGATQMAGSKPLAFIAFKVFCRSP